MSTKALARLHLCDKYPFLMCWLKYNLDSRLNHVKRAGLCGGGGWGWVENPQNLIRAFAICLYVVGGGKSVKKHLVKYLDWGSGQVS